MIKTYILLLSAFFIMPGYRPLTIHANAATPALQQTVAWIQSFKEFRDAVYQHDKIKTKTFIDFPIMNEMNEIWTLVHMENTKGNEVIGEKIKPFTEKDFDLYYNKLFSKRFINAIQKIKTTELANKGETTTIQLKEGKATTCKIIASFDKAEQSLSLNLASNTITKDKDGEIEDGSEFNVLYYFRITKEGTIKFVQVRLAG